LLPSNVNVVRFAVGFSSLEMMTPRELQNRPSANEYLGLMEHFWQWTVIDAGTQVTIYVSRILQPYTEQDERSQGLYRK
jgi:hypothetical protein